MCDYFWKKMENGQGDLADIVRASGRVGGNDIDLSSVMSNDWQFIPSEPVSFFPLPPRDDRREEEEEEEDVFSDPFGPFSRDPLLHEITVSSFFDHGQDLKRGLQQEITRSTPTTTTTTTNYYYYHQ
ncbi:uncharacterized protein LOC120258807 [Dioscorea cayenensis subsp. rotundata]|uniref:Uncharacterized protein LOC120258807 n=1 Tax=Dioscorea cayennensis subsp. rotundata TaxID=55577 RepID=A0AB40B676_DIOCR|nr:uncharacterized protein LOC120258807 [Dioscorea cayenensis subsp. rotundata]